MFFNRSFSVSTFLFLSVSVNSPSGVLRCYVTINNKRSVSCIPSQIKEKLLQLTDKRKDMIDKWEDRWEWLRLGNEFYPVIIQSLSQTDIFSSVRFIVSSGFKMILLNQICSLVVCLSVCLWWRCVYLLCPCSYISVYIHECVCTLGLGIV